ncbi:MAG: hypothetical protein ACP5NZ_04955 [Nanobdellota archaeon]
MKKNNLLILIAVFISLFFIINSVFALTASSSSYSVGRFSTGMTTSNISSTNYQGISLLESIGTTRNAESDSFTSNIGFFDDTVYYRTVSISSYSIYPDSPEVLSNVRLYISALNSQYVWANITRPDSVVETVSLINNDYEYYTVGIVGRYNITFYANSSMGTLSSVIDYFDVTEEVDHPSGGGGGTRTRTIIEECYYLWDCTEWGVCSGGKQIRECANIGTCNGTTNKPLEEMQCTESLFDISLRLGNLKLGENKDLIFNLNLTEKMGVEAIDVHVKYSIINSSGYEVFSQMETKSIKNNLSYEKDISDFQLSDGDYILRIDVLYGNLQRAFTEQKFKIVTREIKEEEEKESFFNMFNYNLVFLLAGLIIILCIIVFLLVWLIRKPKRDKEKIEEYITDGLNAIENKDIYKAIDYYEKIKKLYKLRYDPTHEIRNKIKRLYDKVRENKYLLK